MKNYLSIIVLMAILLSCNSQNQTVEKSPNFIFILADDLGYGEIGIQGQKWIETPNIDQLAREGMI